MNRRHFYAAQSSHGLGFTYDSPCWLVHAFPSRRARDAFVRRHADANTTEAVDYRTACRIAPELRTERPARAWRVVVHQDSAPD